MWTIALPLRVPVSKKKFFILNLNQYRNTHPFVLNKAKITFAEMVHPLIKAAGVPKLNRCTLQYILYPGTARECDVNNVCSIQDKFFSDTLVEHKVLEDDNYKFLAQGSWEFGYIDPENPRVEVIIRSPDHIPLVPPEVVQEPEPMKIVTKTTTLVTFTQEDLDAAILDYVEDKISVAPGASVSITPKEGVGYEIRIEQDSEATPGSSSEKPARKERRKKADPKEAMQHLKEHAPSEPSETVSDADLIIKVIPETPTASPEPELPVVGEEKGHASSLFSPVEVPQQEPEKPKEEAPPAAVTKAPSLFAAFKRPDNSAKS